MRRGTSRYLWLCVEADEYELPIAVADTAKELGDIVGVNTNSVQTLERGGYSGKISGRKYVKVLRNE